jgi:hypothetical protein
LLLKFFDPMRYCVITQEVFVAAGVCGQPGEANCLTINSTSLPSFLMHPHFQYQEESAFKELVSPLEQRRRKFLKRRNEHGDRGGEVSVLLRLFEAVLCLRRARVSNIDS